MAADLESLRIERSDETDSRSASNGPWKILCLILLVLLVASFFYHRRAPATPDDADTTTTKVPVTTPDTVPTVEDSAFSASGWVKLPLHYPVHVSSLIEGRVEELLVVEGDAVTKGQVIARMYDGDLRASLEAAAARVREATAALAKQETGSRPQEVAEAQAEVQRIEADLKTEREVLANSREMQPGGAISLEELLRDESRVAMLDAGLAKAKERAALLEEGFRTEDVDLARATLERARAEEDIAKLQLGYAEITCPIDGIVIERQAEVGQWVRYEDGFLVSLYDPQDLEVRVDVNQDDITRVFLGQKVEISSRAEEGKVYEGEVLLIEPRADIVKNTLAVRVRILTANGALLRPDMVVRARFLPAE